MIEFKTQLIYTENPKDMILIDIPHNLWIECGKKGMLEMDIKINGVQFNNIGLLPRGNGKYSIKFTKSVQNKVRINSMDELNISMELSKPKIQLQKLSGKEYRKIMKPNLIMQTTNGNCGQACIAMLTGVSIEDICKIMHTDGGTTIGQIMDVLDQFDIRHVEKNVRLSKRNSILPEIAILTVHFPEYTHWVLLYKGTYLDPEFGESNKYTIGRITSFLECFEC